MNSSWYPSADLTHLKKRAAFKMRIRHFFNDLGYLEVDTPVLGQFGVTDVYLANMTTQFRGKTYYLQTSPEYHMKRLLAAGSGPIYQLARVFRDDELGRWHNPEFTLLEWYQLNKNHHELMLEVDALLQQVLNCEPLIKMSYKKAFYDSCGIDPLTTSLQTLQDKVAQFGLNHVLSANDDIDQHLFLLMTHVVEPSLAYYSAPVALYDFPPSQAALAQIKDGVAERFEIYYRGVELANGFHELTDVEEQRRRFNQDNQQRTKQQNASAPIDEYFLQALSHGLPPCSGVAVGFERLLALALDQTNIQGTMAFDFSRA